MFFVEHIDVGFCETVIVNAELPSNAVPFADHEGRTGKYWTDGKGGFFVKVGKPLESPLLQAWEWSIDNPYLSRVVITEGEARRLIEREKQEQEKLKKRKKFAEVKNTLI